MALKQSELILNEDGSVYHLNLKPKDIATDIIFVGDQDRVEKITKHFDSITFSAQKREFKTVTGFYKGKKLTVISTGIGPDNIDIVLNELDALVNINLVTREPKQQLTPLNIVRIGTSGALQKEIPLGTFLLSEYALDLNGMLHFYQIDKFTTPLIENAFIAQTKWDPKKARPLCLENSKTLANRFISEHIITGITATAGGFYAPQGRVLRLPLKDTKLNSSIDSFVFNQHKITNLEMETATIYGLCKLLGHNAVSLNAIIANRANGTFSANPSKVIEDLIVYALHKFVK